MTDHITLPRAVVERAKASFTEWKANFPDAWALSDEQLLRAFNAALAAPQAEPVAWQRRDKWVESGEWDFWRDDFDPDEELDPEWAERRPLYAAPQPQAVPPGYKLVLVTYENDLRQAAKHALEALGSLQGGCTDSNDGTVEAITVWCPEVIAELDKALAAAPDLRPKTTEAQPAPASDTKDQQLGHPVTPEEKVMLDLLDASQVRDFGGHIFTDKMKGNE